MRNKEQILDFFVPGVPVPQGSKVAFRHAKTHKPIVMETRASRDRLATWRAAIQLAAHGAKNGDREPYTGPVELYVVFSFLRPKSHLTTRGALRKGVHMAHVTRPDLDKLVRAVKDALTQASVWRDDSQVVAVRALKEYGPEPGAWVTISTWESIPQSKA